MLDADAVGRARPTALEHADRNCFVTEGHATASTPGDERLQARVANKAALHVGEYVRDTRECPIEVSMLDRLSAS